MLTLFDIAVPAALGFAAGIFAALVVFVWHLDHPARREEPARWVNDAGDAAEEWLDRR